MVLSPGMLPSCSRRENDVSMGRATMPLSAQPAWLLRGRTSLLWWRKRNRPHEVSVSKWHYAFADSNRGHEETFLLASWNPSRTLLGQIGKADIGRSLAPFAEEERSILLHLLYPVD